MSANGRQLASTIQLSFSQYHLSAAVRRGRCRAQVPLADIILPLRAHAGAGVLRISNMAREKQLVGNRRVLDRADGGPGVAARLLSDLIAAQWRHQDPLRLSRWRSVKADDLRWLSLTLLALPLGEVLRPGQRAGQYDRQNPRQAMRCRPGMARVPQPRRALSAMARQAGPSTV